MTRNVTLLATSRERLEVDGEHVWQVRPLPVSGLGAPAVRLFLDRARAADPAAAPRNSDVEAVAALCARLDGLPLAIELAAARLPGTTVSELAANLGDRFGLLTVGRRADSRHRSLRAVVDWSYEQLTPEQQYLFAQLAVFHGSFDAAAAHAIADGHDHPADVTRPAAVPGRPFPGDRRAGRRHDQVPAAGDPAQLRPGTARRARTARRGHGNGTRGGPRTWSRGPNAACAAPTKPAGRPASSGTSVICGPRTAGSPTTIPSSACRWPPSCTGTRCGAATPRSTVGPTPARPTRPGRGSPFYPEALASAAFGALYRGDMQAADAAARDAFDAARTLPPVSARRPLEALAEVATFRGELAAAVDLYTRAYDLSIENGDFLDAAWDAVGASAAYAYSGRLQEASRSRTRRGPRVTSAVHRRRWPSSPGSPARSPSAPAPPRPVTICSKRSPWPSPRAAASSTGFRASPWPHWTRGTAIPMSRSATTSRPSANGSKQAPGPRCGLPSGLSLTS